MDKPANKEQALQLSENITDAEFNITINLRECAVGERFTESGA